jgi:anti-sigma factor RsiW
MSCSPFDLKDYFFGELANQERHAVEQHVAACAGCRDELDALGVTRSALLSVPDEEPLRRIAFVSDKVFEPRWWQKLWAAPQLGFASACIIAAAIVFHALQSPVTAQAPPAVAQVDRSRIDAEVAKQVDAAVQNAVAASEARQAAHLADVVNARLKQSRREHRLELLAVQDYLVRMQKENLLVRKASYESRAGEVFQ